MKRLLIIIHSLFLGLAVSGQKITYNHIVDPTDVETKEVMELFENYLASTSQNEQPNPFWNLEDQERSENYDFLESEFDPSLYMGFPVHVLSIKFKEDISWIKAQFSYCKEDGSPYILAIVNYVARKENGHFKLYNSLTYNRREWANTKVGIVDYYYPHYHKFDLSKAKKLNVFIYQICNKFGVEPKPFEYYLADHYDEIQELKGFDYYLGMGGGSKPSGKAAGDKVYCGGLGEYYAHEVFHVQIDDHFPDKHTWVSEGIATLLGVSRGESLEWHIQRAHRYLQNHQDIDLNNMLELRNLDSETAYHYVLGGLIAKKIYDKGGWSLLKDFMSSGKSDENYYDAIEAYLGVKRSELNTYIRAQLAIESSK